MYVKSLHRKLYLIIVGMISAVKRMQREAVAWEEKRPSTENTVMAVSLRSGGGHTVSN